MAKICCNFVAADAKVIFNFALDSVIRKVKKPHKNAVCLKNAYESSKCYRSFCLLTQLLNGSCLVGFYTFYLLNLVFSDVSFQRSSDSWNKQSSLCGVKNQKPTIILTSV